MVIYYWLSKITRCASLIVKVTFIDNMQNIGTFLFTVLCNNWQYGTSSTTVDSNCPHLEFVNVRAIIILHLEEKVTEIIWG